MSSSSFIKIRSYSWADYNWLVLGFRVRFGQFDENVNIGILVRG